MSNSVDKDKSNLSQTELNYSLTDVPIHKRAKVWKDKLNEFFYDYEAKLPTDFITGKIKGCYAGGISVSSVESDAMSVWRTERQISRDGIDAYFVLLPAGARISLAQRGRVAIVRDREYSLVSTSDTYEYIQDKTTLFNNLIIPGSSLRQLVPNADDLVANVGGHSKIEAMFSNFANDFCLSIVDLDKHAREVIGRQVLELLGLALDGADMASLATPIMLAHRRRLLKFIENNFTNPMLDIHLASHKMHLSIRHIQNIFAASNETFSGIIRKRRIQEAYRLLRLRRMSRQSVTQIAFSVGFTELSHFSRTFKNETGYSPTEIESID